MNDLIKIINSQLDTLKECELMLMEKQNMQDGDFNYIRKAIKEIEYLRTRAIMDIDDLKKGAYGDYNLGGDVSQISDKNANLGGYNRQCRCVLCSAIVPEGRQVCGKCENKIKKVGDHETI